MNADKSTEANFMILLDTNLVRVSTTAEILTTSRPGISVLVTEFTLPN